MATSTNAMNSPSLTRGVHEFVIMPNKKKTSKAAMSRAASRKAKQGSQVPTSAAVSYAAKQKFTERGRMRSHRFHNSELVSSVFGSTSLTIIRIIVNPGIASAFPWLSAEASKWEQYRFHSLRYRYVTRTSTSTVGSLILSPDYNLRDAPPATETEATDTMDAVEDAVWKEITCDLSVLAMYPSGPRKLIRSGNQAGDYNLYDSAIMNVCTTGGDNSNMIGKLWVDYDVELYVPQNSPESSTYPRVTSMFSKPTSSDFSNDFDALITGWFASGSSFAGDPLRIGTDTAGVFTPARGIYLITLVCTCIDTLSDNFTATIRFLKNGTNAGYEQISKVFPTSGGSNQNMMLQGIISFSGTDTFAVEANLRGSIGTGTFQIRFWPTLSFVNA